MHVYLVRVIKSQAAVGIFVCESTQELFELVEYQDYGYGAFECEYVEIGAGAVYFTGKDSILPWRWDDCCNPVSPDPQPCSLSEQWEEAISREPVYMTMPWRSIASERLISSS